jgi:hypothetical protein
VNGPAIGVVGGFGRDPRRGQRAAGLVDLVRAALGLSVEAVVTISQLTCREPGCPPVETVIVVLPSDRTEAARRWTIHRPLAEIDDVLVTGLLAHDPYGDNHDRP